MKSVSGLVALLGLAALAIVAMLAITAPVRVVPSTPGSISTVTASPSPDAGSLDSLLDAVKVEHVMKHGR